MDDALRLVVPADLQGERLDKALASLLGVSRTVAKSLLEQGATVDGGTAKPSDRVALDSVIVTPPPDIAVSLIPEPVAFAVVYEDDHILVVDKPPHLVVHPGSGNKTGTLAAGLLHRYPDLEGVGAPGRWGIVHRLDRDTSGLLLVARTGESYRVMTDQLHSRSVGRIYLTMVHGAFGIPTGTIEAPIGRDPSRPTRRAVVAGGKSATTHYTVLREFPGADVSLVRVMLETGRTHQIRVHMAAIDHPVLGDKQYGARSGQLQPPRLFLHATELSFDHPTKGQRMTVESPLPSDLASLIGKIEE